MKFKDIIKLAVIVKENIEKNKKFPTTIKYNNKTYNYGTIAYYFTEFIKNNGKEVPDKIIKNNTSSTGEIISESVSQSDYMDQVKRLSQFMKQNGKIPNNVTTVKSKKIVRPRDYIYALSKIVVFYGTNYRFPNTCKYNSKIYSNTSTSTTKKTSVKSNTVYEYFTETFGKITDFDSALKKIQNHGYGHYYNDKLTNKQVIHNLKYGGTKPNCTDVCQMLWWIAKALGYDVKLIHVKCSSGEGHVFLKLKHKVNTNGKWITRDGACVISDNNKPITCVWCEKGTVIDTNPSWFMESLNK